MDRLLQLGGDKKFLSYDDLNRELPENVVSPDDIEDVLQKLDASNIHVADSDERLIEQAAAIATEEDESDEDLELDLSAGALEKTNDPVRLYLREMGVVPLLTREGEVAIAKRIERGLMKTHKSIARSPIAVMELLKIGEELAEFKINIREVVEQFETTTIVECFDAGTNTCQIHGMCGLKHAMMKANRSFLETLGEYRLSDFIKNPKLIAFSRL